MSTDGMSTRVIDELTVALGDALVVDGEQLDATRSDKSGFRTAGRPLALVRARSIDDVSRTLAIASRHLVPVVTRGAGTGLAGGGTATVGEIVLSTVDMNRILDLSPEDSLAVVEPGVINADLSRAAVPFGLRFAPDPASREISTIGGNIATGAGGLLCAKYGVTRDAVLALTVVLADGSVERFGHRTVKGVTGLDLAALMVGSEGTLGVIVDATVRLTPIPAGGVATIEAWFPGVVDAAAAASAIGTARLRPAVMELIDARATRYIADFLGLEVPAAGSVQLVIQTDGSAAEVEAQAAVDIVRARGGDARVTLDAAEGEMLLAMRRAFHPAMEARGTVLIEDVAVPRSALPAMFAEIAAIEQEFGIPIPTVAHAGDGNLHPNFIVDGDVVPDEIWTAAGRVFLAALDLGGTLTGEHGVGVLKRRWLGDELGAPQVALQRRVKAAFDPLGILNPGKVF